MKDERRSKQEEAVVYVLHDMAVADISIPKLYALSDLPPDLMDEFVAGWPNLAEVRREKIARHLADIMEENFAVDFSPLFAYFLQDIAPEVRRAALDGLWDSTDVTLIPTVLKLMQQDSQESVRVAATSNLGHFVLMDQWGEIPPKAAEPIVAALLAELDKPDVSPAMYRAALESVASSGHGRVPTLIETAYTSRHEQMRLSAVYAMGQSADRRWLNTVLLELDHEDADMRIEAARAAGALSASDAIEKLVELIAEDDDLEVQITAVQALGKIGSQQASEILQALADEESEDMPEELLEAIDEALEEMMWLGDNLDFDLLDVDPDLLNSEE